MAYSYDATLQDQRSRVRFLLQDNTNTTARPNLLDDGEITWALSVEANEFMAAALCAESLAQRARGLSSRRVGDLELRYNSKEWSALAKQLRMRGRTYSAPTAGGMTITDRDALWEDTDLLRPSFFSEVHENPDTIPPTRPDDEEELP